MNIIEEPEIRTVEREHDLKCTLSGTPSWGAMLSFLAGEPVACEDLLDASYLERAEVGDHGSSGITDRATVLASHSGNAAVLLNLGEIVETIGNCVTETNRALRWEGEIAVNSTPSEVTTDKLVQWSNYKFDNHHCSVVRGLVRVDGVQNLLGIEDRPPCIGTSNGGCDYTKDSVDTKFWHWAWRENDTEPEREPGFRSSLKGHNALVCNVC